ncbi:CHASE domain-containing protein, partial [Myxococcota bacterium]|nr:CHASE domain-containing protein [Myxococcota bacterium]
MKTRELRIPDSIRESNEGLIKALEESAESSPKSPLSPPSPPKRVGKYSWAGVAFILILGFILAPLAYVGINNAEESRQSALFDRLAEARFALFYHEIEDIITELDRLSRFMTLHDNASAEEFAAFTESAINVKGDFRAFGWVPLIRGKDRARFEAGRYNRLYPAIPILEGKLGKEFKAAAKHDEYFPIVYRNPPKQGIMGWDILFDSFRKEAVYRARDSGKISLSHKVDMPGLNSKNMGVLVYAPVYKKGALLDSV